MVGLRLSRLRESVIEQLAVRFAHDELSPDTHEARVHAALLAESVRELRELMWDLPAIGDVVVALLWGAVDGIEVVGDGRWLASQAPRSSWLLGRASTCDVRFDARGVSRCHALLVKRGRCWSLVDLDATNGTVVNGQRVRRRRLRPGDRIELGRSVVLAVTGERRPC
ncbi:MAG: hypothetical protein QOJ89_2664 [bacterium]|jgi:hypothetical protein